jgi:hypothetical protein
MPYRPKLVKFPGKNPARPSSYRPTRSDYGTQHKKLRELVLANNPFCQKCGVEFACHAHHLVYPATSVTDYLALCTGCHYAEHNYLRNDDTTDMGNKD